jgi:hypothetical protein
MDDPYGFQGWGLTTKHANPWGLRTAGMKPSDEVGNQFRLADSRLRAAIQDGEFALTQFNLSERSTPSEISRTLNDLMWRHYIVFVSARLANATTVGRPDRSRNFVEVGVCDGLTAYFAIAAGERDADVSRRHFFLLDSWGPMREEDFAPDDKQKVGAYSYLRRERTEENLHPWNCEITFIQGYVPQTLGDPALPDSISWLHIDLNSSVTTTASLDILVPRIADGGICLFDDYGWKTYSATKRAVDSYFRQRSDGTLLALPTGQSLWICHRGRSVLDR